MRKRENVVGSGGARPYSVAMTWQPLSQRMSGAEPDGPYEGIPSHLKGPLTEWIGLAVEPVARELTLRLRIPVPASESHLIVGYIVKFATMNTNNFLNVLDGVLHILYTQRKPVAAKALSDILRMGASVWTVTDAQDGLTQVVGEEAKAAFDAAVSANDAAGIELQLAWSNAYGRNGDPSDAWDHAIKAVEDILIPVVEPNNAKATLGSVLGSLRTANPAPIWKTVLPGADLSHDVAPLISMLTLMWPNPDRHGGASKRTPTTEEAQAVVGLAVTIIQWHRQGWVVAKR